jgi:hypothetical protein
MMPTDVETITKLMLGCFFLMGFLTGATLSILIQDTLTTRKKKYDTND